MRLRTLATLALTALAACGGTGGRLDVETAAVAPRSGPATTRATLEDDAPAYAWDLFLALNQPLTGNGAKVWETEYRQTSTIYLPNGATPTPWGEEPPPPVSTTPPPGCSSPSPAMHDLDSTLQVDGLALLDVWNVDVRYQLLMNQPTFDFIVANTLYNVNGQEAFAAAGQAADFPDTSFELKTSWIWIGQDAAKCADLADKYYVSQAYYQEFDRNGRPTGWVTGWAALAGFHITNKDLPQWVWITFENVHNDEFTQISLELPIDAAVAAANAQYQAQLAAQGSVLANYQLDGVQTTFVDDAAQPTLLANSTIESAFQPQSSCITCHSLASIKEDGEYYNLVDTSGGNVGYYVGNPPDVTAKGFVPLDFVWSLKRASRTP